MIQNQVILISEMWKKCKGMFISKYWIEDEEIMQTRVFRWCTSQRIIINHMPRFLLFLDEPKTQQQRSFTFLSLFVLFFFGGNLIREAMKMWRKIEREKSWKHNYQQRCMWASSLLYLADAPVSVSLYNTTSFSYNFLMSLRSSFYVCLEIVQRGIFF